MSAPGTFTSNFLLRKLGVRSRLNPEYKVTELAPVLVLADMSRSYGVEAVEARAIFQHDQTTLAGNVAANWEIEARGQGGIILEYWGVTSDQATALVHYDIKDTPRSGFTDRTYLQVGGETALSVCRSGRDQGLPGGGWPVPFVAPTDRVYVPAGYYFNANCTFGGIQNAYFLAVWREIPEPLGAA